MAKIQIMDNVDIIVKMQLIEERLSDAHFRMFKHKELLQKHSSKTAEFWQTPRSNLKVIR